MWTSCRRCLCTSVFLCLVAGYLWVLVDQPSTVKMKAPNMLTSNQLARNPGGNLLRPLSLENVSRMVEGDSSSTKRPDTTIFATPAGDAEETTTSETTADNTRSPPFNQGPAARPEHNSPSSRGEHNSPSSRGSDFMSSREAELVRRREILDKACSKHKTKWNKERMPKFVLYSPRAKVVYCQIPKVGSSYMDKILTVLENTDINPVDLSGIEIHKSIQNLSLDRKTYNSPARINKAFKDVLKFFIVRDPYQKAYSVYVDKTFNLAMAQVSYKILANEQGDSSDLTEATEFGLDILNISFTQVLKYSMGEYPIRLVNNHFLTPKHNCDACHVHYNYIAKLETLSDDVSFILSKLNKTEVQEAVNRLDSNNEEIVMRELITRTFDKMNNSKDPRDRNKTMVYSCELKDATLRRIWKTFQIRGFISDSRKYPAGLDLGTGKCEYNEAEFTAFALQALRMSDDREARKAQRQRYYLQAWRSVPLEVLDRFREFVTDDCLLFNYDCNPPEVFEGRGRGDEERNLFSSLDYVLSDEVS